MQKVAHFNNAWLPRFWRLSREMSWIMLGQSAALLGALVGVRLLTQSLSPNSYGELALGLTLVGLVQQLIMGPVQQGVLRFYRPAQEATELNAYLKAVRVLLVRSSLVVIGIMVLLTAVCLIVGLGHWISLGVTSFLFALVSGYGRILDAVQMAARQRAVTAWHQALGQWLRFLLAVALMVIFGASSLVAMIGYVVASCLVLLSQFMFFRRKVAPLVASEAPAQAAAAANWRQRIQGYAWPFTTWGLFSWGQQSSDRWAIQVFSDTGSVGYYSVLYQISYTPMMLLTSLIVELITPILYGVAGDATDPARVKRARHLNSAAVAGFLVLTALGTAFALAFHAQIFALAVAPAYRVASLYLPWMVLSAGIYASGQMAVLLIMSGTKTQILIIPKITSSVLGIILNLVGAHFFGFIGVVYAGVAFSTVYLVWVLILANHAARSQMSVVPSGGF
jgi:O-antigen/teichoic acid export membrane protein